MSSDRVFYGELLIGIKDRIRQGQNRAALSANAEMIVMYWDIGHMILQRQQEKGWGAGVIPRLANDLKNELPEVKGFSERNIGYMIRFAREYGPRPILQQPVAKLPDKEAPIEKVPQPAAQCLEKKDASIVQRLVAQIPWGHNILLMEKVKDLSVRCWYMQQATEQGWSRDTLAAMIKGRAHERQGKTVSNFSARLPSLQSEMARQLLKDPYLFDFLTLEEPFHERELETGLVRHLEKFLLELGAGFAFVGRQYHLAVSDRDFYLDLLFYHLKLRCFIVIELKKGDFKPEYAGKMNFYCSAVDDLLRNETDQPTIGLILCQTKDRILAEYALRDIHKPIGISDYELTRALPESLKSSLPTVEEIETAIRQIVNDAIISREVIDVFDAAGIRKPDISILSDEFLAEVQGMPRKNLALELLKRLLTDEIRNRAKTNLVQGRKFSEMLADAVKRYQNSLIDSAKIIEELIQLAREIREADKRGEALNLRVDELAFYDALADNPAAESVLGNHTLKQIAHELVENVRKNTSIDWQLKESVQAKLRGLVKRILRKYKYPPDDPSTGEYTVSVNKVLDQAELLADLWTKNGPVFKEQQIL
ncbi:MAG: PDDEXK nuclease domain-containing protein [Desulfobacula sp.]|jgi:predicted nuclease of restriction endonuclease-like (RecB) superfamily